MDVNIKGKTSKQLLENFPSRYKISTLDRMFPDNLHLLILKS
jgi:hypothetical protein